MASAQKVAKRAHCGARGYYQNKKTASRSKLPVAAYASGNALTHAATGGNSQSPSWKDWLLGDVSAFATRSCTRTAFAAAAASPGATVPLVTSAIASFIKLYLLLLFVRVLLTWFPNVDWTGQPWTMLRQVTDPYLNLFRNLIPPMFGQIDFTPIFGFLVLQFLAQILGAEDLPI